MVLAILPAEAALVAEVSVEADYDGIFDSDTDISYNPATPAEAHALADHGGGSYSQSDAQAFIGGEIMAYSTAFGAHSGALSANAMASQTTDWLVKSGTLSIGTEVSVAIEVIFHGQLGAALSNEWASANASLKLGENQLYEASGTGGYNNVVTSGMWVGDFTDTGYWHVLDTVDTVYFNAMVGETISLTLSLSTEASGLGYESGATADFSNSGSYAFAGAEDPDTGAALDVQFEMIPEPATLLLLGLGGIVLRKRK